MASKKIFVNPPYMNLRVLFYCLLSSVFLWISFPKLDFEYFAWFGFLPLFFAVREETKRRAFWFSYLCGFVFFILTIYWLVHVTLAGLILLCLYLAFYFAFLGYFFSGFKRMFVRFNIFLVVFLSSLWVILEYIRSQLISGFPWALLGYSQYLNSRVIQFSDITGGFGLSFLVIFVNLCLFELIKSMLDKDFKLFCKILLGLSIIFTIIFSYGVYSINKYSSQSKALLGVSLIQGNIPQDDKWQSIYRTKIKQTYFDLSRKAIKDMPDLIIWPETAYPDYIIDIDKETLNPLNTLVGEIKKPVLLGAVYQEKGKYFNGAILLSPDFKALTIYKKIHLVPFGEYLPLRKYFSFLERIVPIEDFSSGEEFVIFKTRNKSGQPVSFGVLICFEDTILELSRQFRLRGADFLVNITNDAWFKESASPYQHLQASVFRAVENRVYLLRAANTGITCIIDNCGRIIKQVKDGKGRDIFLRGFISGEVKSKNTLSFYSRFGDFFVLFCGLYVFVFAIYAGRRTGSSPIILGKEADNDE